MPLDDYDPITTETGGKWDIAGSNGLFYEVAKPGSRQRILIRQFGMTIYEAKANVQKIIDALNGH